MFLGIANLTSEFGAIGSSVLKSPNGQVLARAAASGNIFVVGSGHEFFNGFLGGRGGCSQRAQREEPSKCSQKLRNRLKFGLHLLEAVLCFREQHGQRQQNPWLGS